MKKNLKAIAIILIVILIAIFLSFAGSQNSVMISKDISLFTFSILIAFAINWIAFIPAYIFQTEKFFDLTGSITYITITVISFYTTPIKDVRTILLSIFVLIWAFRLGSFLFKRILKDGKDSRFDEIKPNFFRYLIVWTLQGLWISFTLAASLVAITSINKVGIDIFMILGSIIWILGFSIEVISDMQKSKWREKKENKGKFINVGLWSRSRHPNYFGEITLWIGIAFIALPTMSGLQYISLISPIFVALLITKVSGVPILEKSADDRWGGQEDYEEYKKNTPVLILKTGRIK